MTSQIHFKIKAIHTGIFIVYFLAELNKKLQISIQDSCNKEWYFETSNTSYITHQCFLWRHIIPTYKLKYHTNQSDTDKFCVKE